MFLGRRLFYASDGGARRGWVLWSLSGHAPGSWAKSSSYLGENLLGWCLLLPHD